MAGLKAAGVTGRGALVMAQQASSPIDMFNQVRDSVTTTCSGSRLPGLQDMSPRGPLIPKPSSYTCLRSDHPREQTFAKWSKGLYMPLPGSDQPGKNWQLNAAPGNRMHSLRLLGGSPALPPSLVFPSVKQSLAGCWQLFKLNILGFWCQELQLFGKRHLNKCKMA